jgi:hypothetical protein
MSEQSESPESVASPSVESENSQETADTPQEQVATQDENEALQRQAVYDYLDSGKQYGTTRNLRTPDGLAAKAHFTYTPPSFARSHFKVSHARYQRGSSGGGGVRSSGESRTESRQSNVSDDSHMAMGDCVPSGWWYRFRQQVASIVSGRQ